MIIMTKTYTPELPPEVLDRLDDYAKIFRDEFPHKKQALWSGIYLQGLLHDGERKSIEPLSRRVTLPPDLNSKDPEQGLQQFVNQSPWDDQTLARRYRLLMMGFVLCTAPLIVARTIPEGIVVGEDPELDAQRFRRTEAGVCLITRAMIERLG